MWGPNGGWWLGSASVSCSAHAIVKVVLKSSAVHELGRARMGAGWLDVSMAKLNPEIYINRLG